MIENSPQAFTQTLAALDFAFGPSKEIIISGERDSRSTKEMLKILREKYIPDKVIIFNSKEKDQMEIIYPLLREYSPHDNQTAVYICENYKCNMPVTTAGQLRVALKDEDVET